MRRHPARQRPVLAVHAVRQGGRVQDQRQPGVCAEVAEGDPKPEDEEQEVLLGVQRDLQRLLVRLRRRQEGNEGQRVVVSRGRTARRDRGHEGARQDQSEPL